MGDYGSGIRRHQGLGDRKLKVVRLSELLNVLKLPPNAEACPMENMCAFCVETQERTLVFAALKDDSADWIEKLCHNTFQKSSRPHLNKPQMEENAIYASVDDVSDFRVVLHMTDAAERCGLQGSYWLQVGHETLILKDTQRNFVREWPYELLRRYGKDKGILSIEAGRRCDCGPGTFLFETPQAEKIFALIQSTIKRKTSPVPSGAPILEVEKAVVSGIQTHSPLPRVPDMTSMAALLENKLRTQEEREESAPSHPAPITLMPLPSLPTQDNLSKSGLGAHSDAVYADPAECVQSAPQLKVTTALYVDPACLLPLKPPSSSDPKLERQDSVYAEVYDKISPAQNKSNVLHVQQGVRSLADEEPIYSEPLKEARKVSPKVEQKADPFAHLYAQVCKPLKRPSSPKTNSSASAKATDQKGDVVYENLGVI